MKLIYMTAAVAAMTLFASCDKKEEKKAKTLATYMDSVNYAFGIDIGNSLKENSARI